MIYREYETGYSDFNEKVEYRISVTTDSFGVYSAMKSAIEMLAEQAEMPKEYVETVCEGGESE